MKRRRQVAGNPALELRGQCGIFAPVGLEAQAPLSFAPGAQIARAPARTHGIRNFERSLVPPDGGARGGNLVGPERFAMGLGRTGASRGAAADGGAAHDQRGPVGRAPRVGDGTPDRHDVVAVDRADHVPAIGSKACRGVVAKPGIDRTVDRDAVVVVQRDQLVEPPHASQRADLVTDAFHQAAVAEKDVGVVVDHDMSRAVELVAQQLPGQRHADRVRQTLAQWAGRGFHAGREAHLGVARGLAVQLPEALQFLDRQVVAAQVQQGIQQHRRMPVGQDEPVAVGPPGIARVVAQMTAPQRDGHLGHAHRRAGVAGVGLLNGVHGQGAQRVGEFVVAAALGAQHAVGRGTGHHRTPRARLRRSIMRQINGVKINCIASSILPPGTTSVLARLIHELWIMFSRY